MRKTPLFPVLSVLIILAASCEQVPDETVVPDDRFKPLILIENPEDGIAISPIYVVGGIATDNYGVGSVYVAAGNGEFVKAAGTNYWSALVTNSLGYNTIRAYAVDLAGNTSLTDSVITVVSNVPQILITSHESLSISVDTNALLTGRVSISEPNYLQSLSIVVNGATNIVTNLAAPVNWIDWQYEAALTGGITNVIRLFADGDSGRGYSEIVRILCDNAPPSIVFSNAQTLAVPAATLFGSVSDDLTGVQSFILTTIRPGGGTAVTNVLDRIAGAYWSYDLDTVVTGVYTNILTASDNIGNSTSVTNVVALDTSPEVTNAYPGFLEVVYDTDSVILYFNRTITNGGGDCIAFVPDFAYTRSWNAASNTLTLAPSATVPIGRCRLTASGFRDANGLAISIFKLDFYATPGSGSFVSLPNGSFEDGDMMWQNSTTLSGRITNQYGITNWYPAAGGTSSFLTNMGYDGSRSFWYKDMTTSTSGREEDSMLIPVMGGSNYTISMWCYAPSSNPTNVKVGLGIRCYSNETESSFSTISLSPFPVLTVHDVWTNVTLANKIVPAGAKFIEVYFKATEISNTSADNRAGFDLIQIRKN